MSEIETMLDERLRVRAGEAARRIAVLAARDDLLDVAYAEEDTPVGRLLLAATPRGIVRIAFDLEPPEQVLEDLAGRISPRVLEAPQRLDPLRRELDEYFAGRRRRFDLPLDWQLSAPGFRRHAQEALLQIPYGETRTYAQLAAEAGSPRAVRAAGTACGMNYLPIVVPCHRIVRTGGALGGYGGGVERKELLLELEGAR